MIQYTVTCKECKRKRHFEAQTFGECLEQAYEDGWRPTGEMTYRVCRKCEATTSTVISQK